MLAGCTEIFLILFLILSEVAWWLQKKPELITQVFHDLLDHMILQQLLHVLVYNFC